MTSNQLKQCAALTFRILVLVAIAPFIIEFVASLP